MNGMPKTRREAVDAGLTFYFTGKPCKSGHMMPRYAKTGSCKGCQHNYNVRSRGVGIPRNSQYYNIELIDHSDHSALQAYANDLNAAARIRIASQSALRVQENKQTLIAQGLHVDGTMPRKPKAGGAWDMAPNDDDYRDMSK